MRTEEEPIIRNLDGTGKRLIIPVYQRNYDWQRANCRQLYQDLLTIIEEKQSNHFFGSIVQIHDEGSSDDEVIIDGQQRMTTVYLLLLAIVNLLDTKKVESHDLQLSPRIKESYLIDKYAPNGARLRLKPIHDDAIALRKLVTGQGDDYIKASNITTNYLYFYETILQDQVDIDELFAAINKLRIVKISLDPREDNAQLIFESLNSTGVDLTEADKIRNYVLMNQPQILQEKYYQQYWHKMEQLTQYQVSDLIRDFLTLKLKRTPKLDQVYPEFKKYVQKSKLTIESVLQELTQLAKFYQAIVAADTSDKNVDIILNRLNALEMNVTRPFLLAVFADWQQKKLTATQIVQILQTIETFIFRRLICGLSTNSLNKVFATLYNDITKLAASAEQFVPVLNYILLNKQDSGRLPNDREFSNALATKDIYHMQSKNKRYLFNRLENQNSRERVNVLENMNNGTYTIEHIMPQTLSAAWKRELGTNYQQVHDQWQNCLANLTLTAYNSNYSNRSFTEKKTMPDGFNHSGFRMSEFMKNCDHWTEKELLERNELLKQQALKLWSYPTTNYVPPVKIYEQHTIDEDYQFTGKKLVSYIFQGTIYQVKSWREMYLAMIHNFMEIDPTPIYKLVASKATKGLGLHFTSEHASGTKKVTDGVYVNVNTDTWNKIHMLRKLFDLYQVDVDELVLEVK